MWKFDFNAVDVVFSIKNDSTMDNAEISFDAGDLEINSGMRENDLSILDSGFRVSEV